MTVYGVPFSRMSRPTSDSVRPEQIQPQPVAEDGHLLPACLVFVPAECSPERRFRAEHLEIRRRHHRHAQHTRFVPVEPAPEAGV